MNETQLRAEVAKRLKFDDIPHELWDDLRETGHIDDVLVGEGDAQNLVNRAKIWLKRAQRVAKRKPPPARKTGELHVPELKEFELARAQALSEILGCTVDALPRVRRLREKFFDGSTLSEEQAREFLSSPATRTLSYEQFKEMGAPLIGHIAHGENTRVGRTLDGRIVYEAPLQINWQEGCYERVFQWEKNTSDRFSNIKEYALPYGGIEYVWPESVLGELYNCSSWLSHCYPWQEKDALLFLITGEFPPVSPLQIEVRAVEHGSLHHHEITLSVAPWVSAETLKSAYRAVQGMALGRDNRPLSAKILTLAKFVASKRAASEKKISLRELMEKWNRAYPDWAYPQVGNFGKDADRAEMALCFPQSGVPYRVDLGPGIRFLECHRRRFGGV